VPKKVINKKASDSIYSFILGENEKWEESILKELGVNTKVVEEIQLFHGFSPLPISFVVKGGGTN
jgi:hypothetical protein